MSIVDNKVLLGDGHRYDLWANLLWLPRIVESGGDEERALFKHILSASKIWIVRFGVDSPSVPPEVVLSESALRGLCEEWLTFVEKFEYHTRIDYRTYRGAAVTGIFGDIARHVVNHSTYHRGQLREKFGAQGLDFHETDFLLYAASRSLE